MNNKKEYRSNGLRQPGQSLQAAHALLAIWRLLVHW